MSSSENEDHHDNSSQCPECKQKYVSSSESEEEKSEQESRQRIVIPLRKDLLSPSPSPASDQIQLTLRTLQTQIESLKQSNFQKDKMIEDLKRQMEHKMTHYMIYGEINKQADEINRLKSEISYGTNVRHSRRANEINEDHIRFIVKEESKKYASRPEEQFKRNNNERKESSSKRRKAHSTHDNYSTLRREFMNSKNETKYEKEPIEVSKEYFEKSTSKPIFNVAEAKKKLFEYEQRIKAYEIEMRWMTNFVMTFIKTMQQLAYRKYQEQIIIPEWSLKKKAKTSWRYMKHVFGFLYSEPQM